ncbi:hypothetical protein diail_12096 [Diaporthe ilicicola]|nr:hypothetical protein diail_12096 [Diaporthe ilicicola]
MAWQLLEAALLLEAQLPIDKIYGLYSLLTAYCALPLPVPDYNKTAEDVYEETAWAWITSRRDLSILKLAARAGHADNLPSWVPAWNQGGSEFLRPLISSHFDWVDSEDSGASGSGMLATIPREAEEPTPVARMLAPGKLHVLDARYAGRVNHAIGPDTSFEQYRLSHEAVHVHLGWCRLVHNVFARSASKYEEALNEMFRSLIYPGIPGFDPEYNGDLQQRRKSFQQWFDFMLYINRSSCSGSSVTAATPDVRASRASALDLYHKILGGIDVEHLKEDLAQHHVGNVEGREGLAQFVEDVKSTKMKLYSVRNHSLCLLDNDNTMAVTNFWCQEGDEIFVFPGTDCPFVLRGAPDGGGYRLVGPALVDRLYRIGYQKWRSEGTDLQDIVLI